MKKIVSLLLVVLFLIPAFYSSGAKEQVQIVTKQDEKADEVITLAEEYISFIKSEGNYNINALGFSKEEFDGMVVSSPFMVYCVDDNRVFTNDIYTCPLVFDGQIVGLLTISWDRETGHPMYSFGKEYSEQLNHLIDSEIDISAGIVICNYKDTMFVTDGKSIVVLLDFNNDTSGNNDANLTNIANTAFLNADTKFYLPISNQSKSITRDSFAKSPVDPPGTNPLNIPIVLQGSGVCGCATMASLLNYRFNTTYTTASLYSAMSSAGYISDGNPSMAEYKSFANNIYSAGCITSYSLSYSQLQNAIYNFKPIMGSWYRYESNEKKWHAISIVGYIKHNSTTYTYYVWNPWHTYYSTISVYSASNVQYSVGSYTYTLNSVLY